MNGETFEFSRPMTISELLDQLHIDARIVAVEHNLKVLKKNSYSSTDIDDQDCVEIVNFVGGG